MLRGVEGVAFTFFSARDVVRHPLVQRIVQAYERDTDGGPDETMSAASAASAELRVETQFAARRPWVPARGGAPPLGARRLASARMASGRAMTRR